MINDELFKSVQQVCPGRFNNGVWQPDPLTSPAQQLAAQQVIDGWPLQLARRSARQRISEGYRQRIAQGICPEGCTFVLRANEPGQQRVSRFLTLLREAEDLRGDESQRASFRQSMVSFDALDGSVVTRSVAQWRADMVSFGLQVLAIETQLANRLSSVDQLNSEDQLQLVSWSQ